MNDLDIFINSPEDATPEELSHYLDEACGDDSALRNRVEELLSSRRRPQKFMEHTTFPAADQDLIDTESTGSIIGNYKLLQKIGEGGFGVVYMADQLAPVKRRVALKIIKLGMDTKQVVARFEVERQALALMEHPNIAKVYDAGATELGRPYFVMELVRGVPITGFCEDQKLDTEARLSLFMDVCSAIQHAHQKGIIHRDLKPGNVIVTLHDDKAVPKVIDFGVAKATQQDLTNKTLFTQFEQFIGTPAYMSPEQTQMSGLDIDTRSDIYALGVLLYELLTGTTPFEAKALANAGQDEIRRVIREDEPPRPSTRLTELQKRTLTHPETRSPGGNIDRDLDWIVMKALEKDRTRRYDTATGLATDIKRHLAHEPVEAGPPGFSYRFGKVFLRHRTAISTSAAMIVLLAGAAVVSTTKWMEARSHKKVAVDALIDAEKAEGSAVWQKRVAVARLAEERFTVNKPEWGIPLLTNLIRSNRSGDLISRVAIERLMFAICHQTIPRKMTPPFQSLSRPSPLSFNGEYMVTTTPVGDSNLLGLQVCSTKNGEVRGDKMTVKEGWRPNMARFSVDETHLLVSSSSGTGGVSEVQLWNWKLGKEVGPVFKIEASHPVIGISPDGNWAMCTEGRSVYVWETNDKSPDKSQEEYKKPLKFTGKIACAVFSPDSKLIAIGDGFFGRVQIFKTLNGVEVGKTMWHKAKIRDLTFDSTGERLLTASADGTARMWDVFTGEELPNSPLVHQSGVNSVEFSPDDSMILTGSSDKTARLWDGASLKPFGAPMQHKDRVISAHFDSKGHQILTATEGSFWLWSVGSSVPIVEGQTRNQLRGAFFSKDSERVFTATGISPSQIRAVRPAQPRSQVFRHYQDLGELTWSTDVVSTARFGPDGKQIITVGVDGIGRIWDVASGKVKKGYGVGIWAQKAEFNADQSLAVISAGNGVHVWNLATKELSERLVKGREAVGIFLPKQDAEGQWRVATITTGPDAVVQIWNADTGQPIGESLALDGRGLSQIHTHFAISADGRRIAAAAGDSRIQIYDVGGVPDSWRLLRTLNGKTESSPDEGKVMGIRFNPVDDTQVVTFSVIGKTRIWDVDAGEQISEFDHSGRVLDAGWSPDGSKIYTASQEGAQIWDVKSGKPHGPALAHANGVSSAAFSPDSRRIITASGDTARIWDVETGLPLSGALKHDGRIMDAHFSPDGSQVLTCGNDTTARLWEVPPVPDGPVPLWVLEWADSLFGLQMNERGTMEEIDWEKQKKIEEDAKSHIDDGFYGRTVEWFYGDPGTREITPFSELTVGKYVRNRLDETTSYKGPHREASLEEALRVDPHNIEAFAKLAEVLLNGGDHDQENDLSRARYYAKLAFIAEPENIHYGNFPCRIDLKLTTPRPALESAIKTWADQARKAIDAGGWETARAPVVKATLARILSEAWQLQPSVSDTLFRRFVDQQHPPVPLLEKGATWRYLDQGQDPGQEWNMPSYDDSAWPSGPAPLGFGDDGEVTVLKDGGDKYTVTYYFRRKFQVPEVPDPSMRLRFAIKADDGAVVYVNGKELFRVRMPVGPIDRDTEASIQAAQRNADEARYFSFVLPTNAVQAGPNTIAVEVHQKHGTETPSSDLSLDMSVQAETAGSTLLTEPLLSESLDAIIAAMPDDFPDELASRWKRAFQPTIEPGEIDPDEAALHARIQALLERL